jgi:hypothetical protein
VISTELANEQGIEAIDGDLEKGRDVEGVRTLTFSAVYFTMTAAINENIN